MRAFICGHLRLIRNNRGDWAWIEDLKGNLLCEIDCGLFLNDIPPHLHDCVQKAYIWAQRANVKVETDQTTLEDEKKEWEWWYNNTRF